MDNKINNIPVKVVFIGGTGRCGTNILKDIFLKHSKVAALPFEHRIFIDPDGIIDFYASFHQVWSPYIADKKVKRLEVLLNELSSDRKIHKLLNRILSFVSKDGKLISPKKYIGWELEKHFPNIKIHNLRLISRLREFTYRGVWPGTDSYTFKPKIYHCQPQRKEELIEILRVYMRNIIRELLCVHNKEFFIEDNTWNIFFAKELIELLPEAKIIHIYRNPRDAIASFSSQRWCPSDRKEAAVWYKAMIKHWLSIRNDLPSRSCHQLKFEDLIKYPAARIKELCEFIGLPFEDSLLDIDLSRAHIGRWKSEFSEDEKKEISKILSRRST